MFGDNKEGGDRVVSSMMIVFVLYYIRGSLAILSGGLHLVKWNHILFVILDEIRDLIFNPHIFQKSIDILV